jgi:hypothetical protein
MSLELAIQENTAALNGVMELLKQFMDKGTTPVAAPEKKRKAATVAAPAATQGDPDGTRYWHIAKHNTVYKQLPGMGDCNISDAVEVTETEYQVQKALIEQKVAAPAPTPAPAAPVLQVVHSAPVVEAAPAPVVAQVTYAEVVDAVKAYFRAFGNDKVVELLGKFGVKRVPELESQPEKFAEVVAQVKSKLGE